MIKLPPVALLAGGLATRMRPHTEKIPKSMLEVAGKPFIAHQLCMFARRNVRRVVICTGYLGEKIEEFVGDGSKFGLSITYSPDGANLRGTGGALKQALPLLGEEFMVIYGDSWLNTNYAAVLNAFHAAKKSALMTVFRNENAWDASNVEFQDGIIRNYDKRMQTALMKYIDWGLGILKPSAFEGWLDTEVFDLADVYAGLVSRGQLAGYEVKERFYEIGSISGLRETDRVLR